jgi:hypothetical protein
MTVGHLALALLALGAAGCGARGAAEAPASPGLQPWEVRYDTEATIDPASGEIHATTRLFVGSEGGIGLLLNRGLEVRSVDGPAVRSYRVGASDFAPTWNLIEIDLDRAAGEAIAVDLVYGGVLDMDGSVGGMTATAIELSVENMWHPLLATFDREMVGALRVRLPDGWTVVSSGAPRVVGGVHALDMRIPQLDVPLFAAPGLTRWSEDGFSVFSRAAPEADARAELAAASACAAFLDSRFGERDPLPEVRFVLVERAEVAMARKNYVVLAGIDPADRLGLHQYICHELAHYWTGSAGPFTPDHWMSESFAEYASALFVRERFGADAFGQRVADYERRGRGHGPIWTPAATDRPSYQVMYQLGPYVLSSLEQRIGEDLFAEFIRRYMVHDIRTTEELLRHLHTVAGPEAEHWFRVELARPHIGPEDQPHAGMIGVPFQPRVAPAVIHAERAEPPSRLVGTARGAGAGLLSGVVGGAIGATLADILTGSNCTRGDLLCFSTAEWAVFGAWFGGLCGLAGGALIGFLFPHLP